MTMPPSASADSSVPDTTTPPATMRVESEAIYAAFVAGAIGAVLGLAFALVWPEAPLGGDLSFGTATAVGAAVIGAAASLIGYWRSRGLAGQEWRRTLSSAMFTVNTISVVIVHTALAFLAVYVIFLVLGLGFIGLPVVTFWSIVLMTVSLGMTAYIVYLSVAQMTTQRMSSLLMAFIVVGTLTAMVTTPDPEWWAVHFSHLGTFDDLSSWVFNGTLIAGGLLVTTFAVYLANDMRALADVGRLKNARSPRTVSVLFAVMGVMLACVGIFPVDEHLWLHNLSASGMAAMYLVLLIGGPRILRGMARTYFLSSWAFLAALLASLVLFVTGYFGLTAFEIIVFSLIFGWIAVFIRFLGVTGQRE